MSKQEGCTKCALKYECDSDAWGISYCDKHDPDKIEEREEIRAAMIRAANEIKFQCVMRVRTHSIRAFIVREVDTGHIVDELLKGGGG